MLPRMNIYFDDGNDCIIKNALPIMAELNLSGKRLLELNIRVVIYVITSSVGKDGYMSWGDIKALVEHGWEIGSHTATHPPLTGLPEEKLREELKGSKTELAYPGGFYDQAVIAETRKHYATARSVDSEIARMRQGFPGDPILNAAWAQAYQRGAQYVFPGENVDFAKQTMCFHHICSDGENEWFITSDEFRRVIKDFLDGKPASRASERT